MRRRDVDERSFMNSDAVMRAMLTDAKTIAVVGLSDSPMKASFGVSRTMQRIGYGISSA